MLDRCFGSVRIIRRHNFSSVRIISRHNFSFMRISRGGWCGRTPASKRNEAVVLRLDLIEFVAQAVEAFGLIRTIDGQLSS